MTFHLAYMTKYKCTGIDERCTGVPSLKNRTLLNTKKGVGPAWDDKTILGIGPASSLFLSLSRILQNTKNKIHIDVQFKNTHAPEINIFSFLTSIVFFYYY